VLTSSDQLVSQNDPTLLPPQPLILDPLLRFPLTARLLSEWVAFRDDPKVVVRQPWIVCGDSVPAGRRKEVAAAGGRVIPVPLNADSEIDLSFARGELIEVGRIPPNALPGILSALGLGSVMIEGGSKVISSFLHAPPKADGSPLVDSVVVTVAPMFIGEGIGIVPEVRYYTV
jgi:2,5-diamino-6-(ribosylamino)-4(3H)-pyrimidinone 5'-phosphate reductase